MWKRWGMFTLILHASIFVFLTLLTQIGGVAWLIALTFRYRLFGFLAAYAVLSIAALLIAPQFGRVPLHCGQGETLQMRSYVFCVLHRNYMDPTLLSALEDVSGRLAAEHDGAVVEVLDASFPFWDGFPMLPHLSHDDGEKVDLAFVYKYPKTGGSMATPSPIGYFTFEPGPTDCPPKWLSLRWDLDWLQPIWPAHAIDDEKTGRLIELLAEDRRVSKILVEPHLVARFDVAHPKVRFQGCRAARHDDHIHLQL